MDIERNEQPTQADRFPLPPPTPNARLSRRQLLAGAGLGAAAVSLPALLAAQATTALAATAASGKFPSRHIAFLSSSIDPFFVPLVTGVRDFARAAGWSYVFAGPTKTGNIPDFVNVMERTLATKPDALAIHISDATAQNALIKRALDRGIPVLNWNQTITSVRRKFDLPFIGTYDEDGGRACGLLAAKYAQKITGRTKGEIVLSEVVAGYPLLEARLAGTKKGVEEYNRKNGTRFTTSKLETAIDESTALARIGAKWSKDKDKIVAFAHADWASWYVAEYMTQNNLKGRFANGGWDFVPGVVSNMQKGLIQWSIGQNPYGMGWVTSALAWMQLEYKYPARDYLTGPEIVEAQDLGVVAPREAAWKGINVTDIARGDFSK